MQTAVGHGEFVHKQSLLRFHDGLAWLLQVAMFLTLGLLVFPSRLVPVVGAGLLLTVFLLVVARPISVLVALLPARMHLGAQLCVAWGGLRGAAPIILSTFPLLAGWPRASTIFNVVFFLVLVSVLVQGTSLPLVARWLGVLLPNHSTSRNPVQFQADQRFTGRLLEITLASSSPAIGKQLVDINLPHSAQILMIHRQDEDLHPAGSTELQTGDRLLILAEVPLRGQVEDLFAPRQ